jgi:ABC-2 type transport system permease protein
MRRIFAQTRKELTQLVRDWRTLGLALVLPIALLMLMSTAISFTARNLPIVVQDLDDSPASRDLIDVFRASITFHVVSWPADRQPEEALTSNAAQGALIIPEHFAGTYRAAPIHPCNCWWTLPTPIPPN